MNTKKVLWILAVVPLIITIFLYTKLPETIPMHFGINGEVDRYGNKIEIFIMPVIILLMPLLTLFTKLDKKNVEKNQPLLEKVVIFVIIFLGVMNFVMLYTQLKGSLNLIEGINIFSIITGGNGILLIVIGNIFPKMKQNSVIGMRTPWTLKNEEVWYKTHRNSGKVFVITGIIMLLLSVIITDEIFLILIILIGTLIAGMYGIIYSYLIYKKVENKEDLKS